MKRLAFALLAGFALAALTGCALFDQGGGGKGYQGPPEYARYFQRGHPENVVDATIVQLSEEAWRRGVLPHGQLFKWQWGNTIRIVRKPVVGWKWGFPLVAGPDRYPPHGAVAYASASTITISNDPDYVYRRSTWVHEFGHMLLHHNGVGNGEGHADHHSQFPDFFRRNNGR